MTDIPHITPQHARIRYEPDDHTHWLVTVAVGAGFVLAWFVTGYVAVWVAGGAV